MQMASELWHEQIALTEIFLARAAIVSVGKILYFATIMATNRDSAH